MNYYNKYIKYKNKYLELKNKIGGDLTGNVGCKKIDITGNNDIKIIINKILFDNTPNDIKCITCLNLSMKNITGVINEPNIFNSFANLQELDLSHNKLEGNIDLLTFPPTLKKLNLSNNSFTGELNNIIHLSNIEYLIVSNNYLNFNFNKLLELGNLIYLDISHNNIDCKIIDVSSGLENLEYLNISYNKIVGEIPKYFLNLSKIKYLNFSNTLMNGKFNQELLCLNNVEYLDFSIENYDFNIRKTDCYSLVKNNYGSCWNLAIILMFLLGDKTSKIVIEYFNQYNTFEKKYEQITLVDKKYNLDTIFTKSYSDTIELIKYVPDNKVHPDRIKFLMEKDNFKEIKKLKKQSLYMNKFIFNKNINTILNFITQVHNRIKFLNIHLDNDKIYIIEDITVKIEEQTQLLYGEIFPRTGRTGIGGGYGWEEFNFCLLLGIIILNKQIKFDIFYNTNAKKNFDDFSNLVNVISSPYDKIQQDYVSKYNSCIGIIVHVFGHVMCFYECEGIKLFNNCFYENKSCAFDYGIMFQNMNYLNKLDKQFNIYMVSKEENQYFIFKIVVDKTNIVYTIADNLINNISTVDTVDISNYKNLKEVENFIFVQTYQI
jgi:hypothetical protein